LVFRQFSRRVALFFNALPATASSSSCCHFQLLLTAACIRQQHVRGTAEKKWLAVLVARLRSSSENRTIRLLILSCLAGVRVRPATVMTGIDSARKRRRSLDLTQRDR